MATVGIDVGAKTIKIVILNDNAIIGKELVSAGFESKKIVNELYDKILSENGLNKEDISAVVATGAGKEEVDFATKKVTVVTAGTKGAIFLFPRCFRALRSSAVL